MKPIRLLRYSLFVILLEIIKYDLLAHLVIDFSTIEFTDEKYNIQLFELEAQILPLLTFILSICLLNVKYKWWLNGSIVVGAFIVNLFFYYILAIHLFVFGMCGRSGDKTVFVHAKYQQTKIVQAEFGCGATDSDPSVTRTYKITPFLFYFQQVVPIDTMKINRKNWARVQP